MIHKRRFVLLAAFSVGWVILFTLTISTIGFAATFTVNSTGHGKDLALNGRCDTGNVILRLGLREPECTLRAAIQEVNNFVSGTHTIQFNIPSSDLGCNAAGVCTIKPQSSLPAIGAGASVIINGYTQPGAKENPNPLSPYPIIPINAVLRIELDGSNFAGALGLSLAAPNSTIKGLVLNRFPGCALSIQGKANTGNKIVGNFFGTDATGAVALSNGLCGVFIGTNNNDVDGNVISGGGRSVDILGVSGNRVRGNLIGTDISGTNALGKGYSGVFIWEASNAQIGPNNVIADKTYGVYIYGTTAEGNKVFGNLIGTNSSGTGALGNGIGVGIYCSGSNEIGIFPGGGNLISGNKSHGVEIGCGNPAISTPGNKVQGNDIGRSPVGAAPLANGGHGVHVYNGASQTTIGGTKLDQRNTISGNMGSGIAIVGGAKGTLVQGNSIGTLNGTAPLGNGSHGVLIENSVTNTIGDVLFDVTQTTGGAPCTGGCNIIAHNGGNGVAVTGSSTGNRILVNSIFANGGVGIDLGADGVTANVLKNPEGQNSPFLTEITGATGGVTVQGILHSAPNSLFNLAFFANSVCDPSGHGEGQTYLGKSQVTTDGSGEGSFNATFMTTLPTSSFITVTAIRSFPAANTSEFSQCLQVGQTQSPPFMGLTVNSTSDVDNGTCSASHCSLREAINAANALPGPDKIGFNIPVNTDPGCKPATGVCTIKPGTTAGFPKITDSVIIDGYTQPGAKANTNPITLGSNAQLKIELTGFLSGNSPANLVLAEKGLVIEAGNSTVRGLVINAFLLAGIEVAKNLGLNVIEGNFIGTDSTGTQAVSALQQAGISIFGSNDNTIGGTTPPARNLISGSVTGVAAASTSSGNKIKGNFIGTDITGTQSLGNSNGVIIGGSGNTIGGTTPEERNVISGNGGAGVKISTETLDAPPAASNQIQANFIGTQLDGVSPLGNGNGIVFDINPTNTLIGGSVGTTEGACTGACNVIAFNAGPGVVYTTSLFKGGNIISRNSIFSNAGYGIDNWGFGIDTSEIPVLMSASSNPSGTTVEWKLPLITKPNDPYTVEFFANDVCDPLDYGEGRTFLGATAGVAPSNIGLPFTQSFTTSVPAGSFITATATIGFGHTSEFSKCVAAWPETAYHVDVSYTGDVSDGSKAKPWKTISQAAAIDLKPGDFVVVHPGTYRETVSLNYQGTKDAPITFAADGEVVIKGSDPIVAWNAKGGGIYSHKNWIYKEPIPVPSIAAPNMFNLVKKVNGIEKDFMPTYQNLAVTVEWVFNDKKKDYDIHVKNWDKGWEFLEKEFPDVLYSLGRNQVFVDEKPLREVVSYDALKPGTFYIDPKTQELFVFLADSSNPAKHQMEGSTRDILVNFDDSSSFIVFKGFKMRHASSGIGVGYGMSAKAMHAVRLGGTNHVFENNKIQYVNGIGLNIPGHPNQPSPKEPNFDYMNPCDQYPPDYKGSCDTIKYAELIQKFHLGYLIKGNIIEHSGHLGIAAINAAGVKVHDNIVRFNSFRTRFLKQGWAGGGIKIHLALNWDIKGLKAYYNYYHGLWFDVACFGNKIQNSVFYGNNVAVRLEGCNAKTPDQGTVVTENIMYSNVEGVDYSLNGYLTVSNNLIAYNDYGILATGVAVFLSQTNKVIGNLVTDNENANMGYTVYSHDTVFDNNLYYGVHECHFTTHGAYNCPQLSYWARHEALKKDINSQDLSADEKGVLIKQMEYHHGYPNWNSQVAIRSAYYIKTLADWRQATDVWSKEANFTYDYSGAKEASDNWAAYYKGTYPSANESTGWSTVPMPSQYLNDQFMQIPLLPDQNTIYADPKYLDPVKENFCLAPGSIASVKKIGPAVLHKCK